MALKSLRVMTDTTPRWAPMYLMVDLFGFRKNQSPDTSYLCYNLQFTSLFKTTEVFLSYSLNFVIIMTIPIAEPKQTAVLKWGYQSNATVEKTKRLYP